MIIRSSKANSKLLYNKNLKVQEKIEKAAIVKEEKELKQIVKRKKSTPVIEKPVVEEKINIDEDLSAWLNDDIDE